MTGELAGVYRETLFQRRDAETQSRKASTEGNKGNEGWKPGAASFPSFASVGLALFGARPWPGFAAARRPSSLRFRLRTASPRQVGATRARLLASAVNWFVPRLRGPAEAGTPNTRHHHRSHLGH